MSEPSEPTKPEFKPPQFDEDEQYLLKYLQTSSAIGRSNASVLVYLVVGGGLAIWGLAYATPLATVAGLLVLIVARLQEMGTDRRWVGVWSSIAHKYEQALASAEEALKPPE